MNRHTSTHTEPANSFVSSLKQARETRETATTRNRQQASTFSITQPHSYASTEQDQVDFDSEKVAECDELCPDIRLVKRYLSHSELTAAIPNQTDVLTITELFKQVSPPDFKRPATSAINFVVLGIVATKSESKTTAHGTKYVTLTISDLRYDVSLALHGKAQEKYYKVRPGTLIALFNPNFYIQKAENMARNLALSCAKDGSILEIGQAKDLGQCQSMTTTSKQSRRCRNWVDVRKTHYCEFHLEQKCSISQRPECSAASGKLWNPRTRANGKNLTVVEGGAVKWKQGLQFDTQANQGKFGGDFDKNKLAKFRGGFTDAPIGRVYKSTRSDDDRKTNAAKYEEALSDKQKRADRQKWMLQRISADNQLTQKLSETVAAGGVTKAPSAKTKPAAKPSQFGLSQMRKLGFMPKHRVTTGNALNVPQAVSHDSDSDLEIV